MLRQRQEALKTELMRLFELMGVFGKSYGPKKKTSIMDFASDQSSLSTSLPDR